MLRPLEHSGGQIRVYLSAIDKYHGHFSINLALSKLIMSPAKLVHVYHSVLRYRCSLQKGLAAKNLSLCHTKSRFHCVGLEFPESRAIVKNPWYFSWKRACHGVLTATMTLLRSSHGVLWRSNGVLFDDSLRPHDAFTALSWRVHCADDVFKTQCHLKECRTGPVQTSQTTTES